MKQPDTSALRERLDNYTPEQDLEQDMQKLEDLQQEVNCQIVTIRNLLKEINAVKEELAKVSQCSAAHIKAEEELLERHRKKLSKCLCNNEGIWLSNRWLIFMAVAQIVCYLTVVIWALLKK